MKNRLRSLCAVAALATLSCSDGTGPSAELLRARTRWEREGPSTYNLVITRTCECLPEATGPVTVGVVNGVVQTRTYVGSGQPVGIEYSELFPDVPGLFRVIEDAIRLDPAEMRVTYHPAFGHPTAVFVDFSASVADEELIIGTTLLLPEFRLASR